MSRIHDALKKAEQEKLQGVISGGQAEPASTGQPVSAPGISEIPDMLAAAPVSGSNGHISLEALSARCRLAQWKPNLKTMLFFQNQDHSIYSEAFRTLRSRLYKIREKMPLQSVLITSALPGEGKTFVSANLAQVIVRQHGKRVLLVDADLRLSQVHAALGAPSGPGLSDYLRDEADEYAIVQRGSLENLYFIPGGKPVSNAAELIANGRLKKLIHRLSSCFDWIILDSPPSVPISDSSLLAGYCDGVVLVVEASRTPVEMVQQARREFQDKPILGVVLNRVDAKSANTSYYYGVYGQSAKSGGSESR